MNPVVNIPEKRQYVYLAFLAVALIWMAGYLALFPGVYGIDAPTWYTMWNASDVSVSSQWSLLISFLFAKCVGLGEYIFHNVNFGVAIYTFLQMSLVLLGVLHILKFMQRRLGNYALIFTSIFFACVPTHMILAVTTGQDSLFALCSAMCSLQLIEIYLAPDEYWGNFRNQAIFAFWLCLSCVIRNNGLYAMLVMGILSLFFFEKQSLEFA